MDWATRKVLSWRLSNTLDASFCVEALDEAIAKYGKPEIMNTDQGSQYTGLDWIKTLTEGRDQNLYGWAGPLSGQHLHRAALAIPEAGGSLFARNHQTASKPSGSSITGWRSTTRERPHTALDKRTPDAAYFDQARYEKRHEHKPDAS